jgi:hypothetical protein
VRGHPNIKMVAFWASDLVPDRSRGAKAEIKASTKSTPADAQVHALPSLAATWS